jgi:PIN domain nuclease of toxin-antitoxin system
LNERLLLDTHIVLWLDSGAERLRLGTRALIDQCWSGGGTLYVSSVTAWEISLLADTGRVALDVPVVDWLERFMARPGLETAPLSWRAAAGAFVWPEFESRDPADRWLIATAIELNCPLVTYDERIAAFGHTNGSVNGFRVAA